MNPSVPELESAGKISENHATSLQVRKRSQVSNVKAAVVDKDLRPEVNASASGVFAPVVMIECVLIALCKIMALQK